MIKGIDVSSYQSNTPSLKGMDFCIVKATEGTGYVNPKQVAQAAHARKAGLVVGFYHFVRPGSMTAQAKFFVEKAASIDDDLLVLDWEDAGVSSAQKDQFLAEVKRLRGKTHRIGLYCNTNFWLNKDKTSNAGDFLWIAQYGVGAAKPKIQHKWVIHQYTDDPIDTNVARFESRGDMFKWAKMSAPKPEEPKPTPPKPEVKWLKIEGVMPELKYGDDNWHVDYMQRQLNRFLEKNIKVTGKYDSATAKAVHQFYKEFLDFTTTSGGKVFGAGGWERVLSLAADDKGNSY